MWINRSPSRRPSPVRLKIRVAGFSAIVTREYYRGRVPIAASQNENMRCGPVARYANTATLLQAECLWHPCILLSMRQIL